MHSAVGATNRLGLHITSHYFYEDDIRRHEGEKEEKGRQNKEEENDDDVDDEPSTLILFHGNDISLGGVIAQTKKAFRRCPWFQALFQGLKQSLMSRQSAPEDLPGNEEVPIH